MMRKIPASTALMLLAAAALIAVAIGSASPYSEADGSKTANFPESDILWPNGVIRSLCLNRNSDR